MTPDLFYSHIVILVLLWFWVMRPYLWPSRGVGSHRRPVEPEPITPKRQQSSEPKPFTGLTHKPWLIAAGPHRGRVHFITTESRRVFATPATSASQAYLASHCDTASLRHAKVAGNRSPYEGDWVYWSRRQRPYPTVQPRVATLLKRQQGRCTYYGLYCQHADRLEMDDIHGDQRHSHDSNLQALHGYCHDAKTLEREEHRPVGMRDKHRDTEERCDAQVSCAVLEQR